MDTALGFSLLFKDALAGGSMASCSAPFSLPCARDSHEEERGAVLERLSQRVLPSLPRDCVFIRWDLMVPAWTDDEGMPLDKHLQELRMNASTRWRQLRKAPVESSATSTMVVDLENPDSIMAKMDDRTRYSVRLARRRGTRVRRAGESELSRFHALHAQTASRQGFMTFSEERFRGLFEAAREHDLDLSLYLAEKEEETAAAAIFARNGTESWYLFAGSSPEHRSSAGPSAILHQAMLEAASAGVRRFDLVGAAPRGVMEHPLADLTRFKAGFGGRHLTRAGAWDFVLRPDLYARHAGIEALKDAGHRAGLQSLRAKTPVT
jgi:lipid II:glycine glycyltransferase (peptidoglycan interpeptide bridge formation enzyme)